MSKDKKTDRPIFAAKIATTYLLCRGVMPEIVNVLTSHLGAFGVSVITRREMTGKAGEVILLGYAPEDTEWFATNRPGMTVTCLSGTVEALSELYARYGREIPALFVSAPLIVTELLKGDGDGDGRTTASAD